MGTRDKEYSHASVPIVGEQQLQLPSGGWLSVISCSYTDTCLAHSNSFERNGEVRRLCFLLKGYLYHTTGTLAKYTCAHRDNSQGLRRIAVFSCRKHQHDVCPHSQALSQRPPRCVTLFVSYGLPTFRTPPLAVLRQLLHLTYFSFSSSLC